MSVTATLNLTGILDQATTVRYAPGEYIFRLDGEKFGDQKGHGKNMRKHHGKFGGDGSKSGDGSESTFHSFQFNSRCHVWKKI